MNSGTFVARRPAVRSRFTWSVDHPMDLGIVLTRRPYERSRFSRSGEHPLDLVNRSHPSHRRAEPV